MSLVVEDGTAKANAEAFASVTQFKTFFGNRGIDVTAISDTAIEQMLRIATDYMSGEFRRSWQGERATLTQALDWPRYNVLLRDTPGGYGAYPYMVAPNIVPVEVINANILLAYKASQADNNELAPDIERVAIREVVDVIEVEYDPKQPVYTQYRQITAMLAIYMKGSNGAGVDLVRC